MTPSSRGRNDDREAEKPLGADPRRDRTARSLPRAEGRQPPAGERSPRYRRRKWWKTARLDDPQGKEERDIPSQEGPPSRPDVRKDWKDDAATPEPRGPRLARAEEVASSAQWGPAETPAPISVSGARHSIFTVVMPHLARHPRHARRRSRLDPGQARDDGRRATGRSLTPSPRHAGLDPASTSRAPAPEAGSRVKPGMTVEDVRRAAPTSPPLVMPDLIRHPRHGRRRPKLDPGSDPGSRPDASTPPRHSAARPSLPTSSPQASQPGRSVRAKSSSLRASG